ncbi:MAG: DUF4192 domain-containing protein [Nocardiaceae bacterium]|nr:DUF4192 domain-containing protein [Nocardiaceae bacterium]
MPSEFDLTPIRCSVTSPADLIAAVPAMLGFFPTTSIVLMFVGGPSGRRIGPIVRYDMIPAGFSESDVEHIIGSICERAVSVQDLSIQSVICLFVDAWPTTVHDMVLRVLDRQVHDYGLRVSDAYWTPEIAPGKPYRSMLADRKHGRLPDPTTSEVAAASVLSGRRIFGSRDDLAAVFASTPCPEADEVARRLRRPSKPPKPRLGLQRVLRAVWAVGAGESVSVETVVVVSRALGDKKVRDAALALAATNHAKAAECLWTAMARLVPAPHRAEPLTLLGHMAYLDGDGAMASSAFGAALECDPQHVLAGLLDESLQSGIAPAEIRAFTACGFDCAAQLGVELSPAG